MSFSKIGLINKKYCIFKILCLNTLDNFRILSFCAVVIILLMFYIGILIIKNYDDFYNNDADRSDIIEKELLFLLSCPMIAFLFINFEKIISFLL
ncbi:hypothetical protein bsdtb5_17090 [Anaeromicropila herbilytica]|uniref:Uncharacterized protein n=1 Tax=Anaeromicropila herbilytica TaxID=2785025 RepID=A0A7R7EKF1_9FIRM|nr:hypothetical protein bsdtb5_17090 [Anaeromicropila herbilytica]